MRLSSTFILSIILLSFRAAQNKVDLQQLKLDENITSTIQKLQVLDKMEDAYYGLKSYQISNLNGVSYGSTKLSKYALPGGALSDFNDVLLHVTDYSENKFLGLTISLVNKEEGESLLKSLIKEFGTPEARSANGNKSDLAFFWDAVSADKWVFYTSHLNDMSPDFKRTDVQCTIVRRGTRVENSQKQDVFTILESFNLSHPKE